MSEESATAMEQMAKAIMQEVAITDPDMNAIVEECADRAQGDVSEAAQLLLHVLMTRYHAYYQARAAKAMQLWAENAVRSAASCARRTISTATVPVTPARGLSADTMAAHARTWMDWPVLPGQPLRTATRAVLLQVSARYMQDAKTYTARGQWLEAIAKRLKDDKAKVQDVMSEADVAKSAEKFGVAKPAQ